MKTRIAALVLLFAALGSLKGEPQLTTYVNPFLGTAPLTDPADIGFTPPWRVWAGLVFPGASVPNAMVQLSPITRFGSRAGYEYENKTIRAFAHTNKGHWNLCNFPSFQLAGEIDSDDFESPFSHQNESAHPGYYQVFLERYHINAELTSTLRCGFHRYTYKTNQPKKLVVNLAVSNERIRDWHIEAVGDHGFQGFQTASEKVFFYALASQKIAGIQSLRNKGPEISVVSFADSSDPNLEIKLGLSFVSVANARLNLETELAGRSFDQVRGAAFPGMGGTVVQNQSARGHRTAKGTVLLLPLPFVSLAGPAQRCEW